MEDRWTVAKTMFALVFAPGHPAIDPKTLAEPSKLPRTRSIHFQRAHAFSPSSDAARTIGRGEPLVTFPRFATPPFDIYR